MKKFLAALMIFLAICQMTAFAEENYENYLEILKEKTVTDDIITVSIKDVNQPHTIWELSGDEKDEFIKLFDKFEIVNASQNDLGTEKYVLNTAIKDRNISAVIYDNGIAEITEGGVVTKKFIFDNEHFFRCLNKLLTTQSKGYGNISPSKSSIIEVSDWAKETFEYASDKSLIPEYMKVGYLTDNITREQFCDLISALMKNLGAAASKDEGIQQFEDTDNENVKILAECDIVVGKSENSFAPNDFLTREETATILQRMLKYFNADIVSDTQAALFDDDISISDWAKNSVYKMKDLGIMIGAEDNMFLPNKTLTKEQAITVVMRIHDEFFVD